MSIAICRIADLRNNNDPSVGGGRGVGSGAMTGKRETNVNPKKATPPRERRGEIPLAGLGVQERLLPTLNAVLMPSTTACLHNCSGVRVLETVSRPSLRRLSRLLSLQKSPSLPPIRVFGASPSRFLARSSRFSAASNYLFRLLRLSLSFILRMFFPSSFTNLLPRSRERFFSALFCAHFRSLPFRISRWFLHNLSRLYFCTHSFSSIDTFSPYCRPRGRCA